MTLDRPDQPPVTRVPSPEEVALRQLVRLVTLPALGAAAWIGFLFWVEIDIVRWSDAASTLVCGLIFGLPALVGISWAIWSLWRHLLASERTRRAQPCPLREPPVAAVRVAPAGEQAFLESEWEARPRWQRGEVVPARITILLDARGLYGPQVDIACGVREPAVDEWDGGGGCVCAVLTIGPHDPNREPDDDLDDDDEDEDEGATPRFERERPATRSIRASRPRLTARFMLRRIDARTPKGTL